MTKRLCPTAARLIEADSDRVEQAMWLAYCHLGPEPDFKKDRRAHIEYVRRFSECARQIAGRLN